MGHKKTGIDRYAQGFIRAKARSLVGKFGYTPADRKDIEQDLTEDLLRRLLKYDPRKSDRNVFVTSVVNNRVFLLIRERIAMKRTAVTPPVLLDEEDPSLAGDPCDAASRRESFDHDDFRQHWGNSAENTDQRRDLALDVAAAVNTLSPALRDICLRLRTSTVTDLATEMGMPRGTLYECIRRIRQAFIDHGFDEFHTAPSDAFQARRVSTPLRGQEFPDDGGDGHS